MYCGLDGAGGITAGCFIGTKSFDGCAGCQEIRDSIVCWTEERILNSFGQLIRRASTALSFTASIWRLLAWHTACLHGVAIIRYPKHGANLDNVCRSE